MDITLSETERLLQQSIRAYLTDNVSSARIRELEGTAEYDTTTWKYLHESGFVELPVPSELGGPGGSLTEFGIIVEEAARRPATVPIAETGACLIAISRYGSNEGRELVTRAIMDGRMVITPAVLEASRDDGAVDLEVSGGRLSGRKLFVDFAESASHHLVAARNGGAINLFLVAVSPETVAFERVQNIAATPQAHVVYADAPATLVGGEEAYRFLRQVSRLLTAAQCLGAAQRSFEMTVEYVGGRVQFGRPIGSFQAVQHHIANMATMVTAARFLVAEALWKLDTGAISGSEIEYAKAWASRTASEVPMMAHHLHGGIGVTLEYDLQFLSRRGKERSVAWGSSEECLREIADNLRPVPA